MDQAKEDKNEDLFLRQRRNLISISLFIILYRALGLEVGELSVLGNSATVKAGSLFPAVIFLVLLYFSWRYTHYLNILRSLDDSVTQYKILIQKYFKIEISKIIALKVLENESRKKSKVIAYHYKIVSRREDLKRYFFPFTVDAAYKASNTASGSYDSSMTVSLSIFRQLNVYVKTFFDYIFMHKYFSEYIFPYIFALLAICELFHYSLVLPVADILVPGYQRPNP